MQFGCTSRPKSIRNSRRSRATNSHGQARVLRRPRVRRRTVARRQAVLHRPVGARVRRPRRLPRLGALAAEGSVPVRPGPNARDDHGLVRRARTPAPHRPVRGRRQAVRMRHPVSRPPEGRQAVPIDDAARTTRKRVRPGRVEVDHAARRKLAGHGLSRRGLGDYSRRPRRALATGSSSRKWKWSRNRKYPPCSPPRSEAGPGCTQQSRGAYAPPTRCTLGSPRRTLRDGNRIRTIPRWPSTPRADRSERHARAGARTRSGSPAPVERHPLHAQSARAALDQPRGHASWLHAQRQRHGAACNSPRRGGRKCRAAKR